MLVTSNLMLSEFQGDRMTASLRDRLTHRCEITAMNGEICGYRESIKPQPQNDLRIRS
ncbi:MAG: Mobile element protein [Gemmataceae bacterium]|nr:Mobile element protein [Gemmataceae bacterium]